jgi:glutamyl-tRNA synthetase
MILRIEDTDRSRYVEGAVEGLITMLRWSGINIDEGPETGGPLGPYVQSERLNLYQDHAGRLIRSGHAYYAFDTPEELEEMRRSQEKMKIPPKYDRRALKLTPEEIGEKLSSGIPYVIRMRVPESETISFDDVIRGTVEFSSDRIDDQILMKSDGYPTYHLANVVDDHLMQISHVIRGEEWISSTPKHVLLSRYFGWVGWEQPVFAHLPLLLNADKAKLSTRQGDVTVEEYRDKGYLSEALVNFVALLGWNPGDEREIFGMDELVKEFSLERVGKAGAVFNLEKLEWMNTQHIRMKQDGELLDLTLPELEKRVGKVDREYAVRVVGLVKERMSRTTDLADWFLYFFEEPELYDENAKKKYWKSETPDHLRSVAEALEQVSEFSAHAAEEIVRSVAVRFGIGAGKLIHPIRLSLTGVSVGPGLFEMMEVMGKDRCVRRIELAVAALV